MALQDVLNGPAGVALALGLARVVPPRQGHWLADRLGGKLAGMRKSAQVRAVEANQAIVGRGELAEPEIRQITKATFQSTARCIYDFYHIYDNPRSIAKIVEIDSSLISLIEDHKKKQRGVLIGCPHFSNFDLALRAAVLAGLRPQVLGYPQPHYGYRLQNRIRKVEGMELTPISFTAMQNAIKRLKDGGIVLTGIDRPISESRLKPVFFGHPSTLPVSYVQLAIKAGVQVVVVHGRTFPDGHYCVQASDPIPMRRINDPNEEVLWNIEQILKIIEQIILSDPKQWSMFYPVWPNKMNQN